MEEQASAGPSGDRPPSSRIWHLAALLVLASGLGVIFRVLWGADATAVAAGNYQWSLTPGDLRFVIWLVARNAAESLARLGEKRAVDSLLPLLEDENEMVQETVEGVLTSLGWKPDKEG